MAQKTAAILRAELRELRTEARATLDEYDGKTIPAAVLANLNGWGDEMDALLIQYEATKAREESMSAERQRMRTIFQTGQAPAQPTNDGRPLRRGGFAASFLDAGWHPSAQPSVTIDLAQAYGLDLMAAGVDLTGGGTTPSTYSPRRLADIADLGQDRRFLWPWMPTQPIGDETSIEDFRQTGSRAISGDVERAVAAVTDKATLALAIDHVVTPVATVAVLIEDIPAQVLRSIQGISQFLENEARYALDQAIDAHVLAQILAATPPNGNTGADIFAQVRSAIAAMRLVGAEPDLAAFNPTDSAALDLLQDNENRYYGVGPARSGTKLLWDLRVVEHTTAAGNEVPMLIDSRRIGVLYLGTARLEADMFTGFKTNLVSLRIEANVLMHVRQATAAYTIEA